MLWVFVTCRRNLRNYFFFFFFLRKSQKQLTDVSLNEFDISPKFSSLECPNYLVFTLHPCCFLLNRFALYPYVMSKL